MENFEKETIQRLTRIETKIDNGISAKLVELEARHNDSEKRLRFLEKGYFVGFGILVVAEVLLRFIK